MTLHVDAPAEASLLGTLVDAPKVGELLGALQGVGIALVDAAGESIAANSGWVSDGVDWKDVMGRLATPSPQVNPAGALGKEDGRILVAAPLRLRQRFLGAVMVMPSVEETTEARCLEMAKSLALVFQSWAEARFELQNVVGELVLRYEELSVVYDSAETIVSVMNLDEVSRRILIKARDMLDVDNASLMLVDPETQTLKIQDAIGLERQVCDGIRLRMGEEISGWVAREGKPLLIEDIESHPLFKKVNKERYINRSLLSVP